MQPKIINLEQFNAVGIKREINCENGNNHVEIPQMWDEFNMNGTTEKIALLNDSKVEGLLGICIGKTENTIDYWIAISSEMKSEFDTVVIPASKWAIFNVEKPVLDNIPQMWQYIFSEWILNADIKKGNAPDMEVYKQDADGLSCEIWISIM